MPRPTKLIISNGFLLVSNILAIVFPVILFNLDVMDQNNLNVNTPNAALLRRGSAISMSNEINMNNLAGKLNMIRKKSCASIFSDGSTTSSDSESDVEDNGRRLSGKSSIFSMMSRKSNRRNSKETPEYDTADFDLTQVSFSSLIMMIY